MKRAEKLESIETAAAYWSMRLSSPKCGPADREAFEAWYSEDPAHSQAFERTERALAQLDRHLYDPEMSRLVDQVLLETKPRHVAWQRWAVAGAALAATLMIVLTGPQMSQPESVPATAPNTQRVEVFDTKIGQRSTVTLADESTITLNTNSRVEVVFNSNQREIKLVRGQVLFDVAKDKSRPFIVQAGRHQITALGTAFDVRLEKSTEVQVLLIEGRVAVDELESGLALSDSKLALKNRVELIAGERLIASVSKESVVEKIDPSEATLWLDGQVIFRATPLADALEEINRYSKDQLRVGDDPRLHQLAVSGVFNTGRHATFLSAIETMYRVDAQRTAENEITLVWRE